MGTIDYDSIAPKYNRRYRLHSYPGTRRELVNLVRSRPNARALELGCGTGHWLAELSSLGCSVAGIDPSAEMLAHAARGTDAALKQGVAEALPWAASSFDVVFCINALHHFAQPAVACAEAHRVLDTGGVFLSIGLDPHEKRDEWYVYEYFPETLVADLARFPSRPKRFEWLRAAGFQNLTVESADHLVFSHTLEEATTAGVLEQSFTSQLTALSPAQYASGIKRMRANAGAGLRLTTDLILYATRAEKRL